MAQGAPSLPTGTVTFLFSDIEGSTRLLTALGDRYPQVLEEHAAIVRKQLAAHDGTVVSTVDARRSMLMRGVAEAGR